jgi:HlyD family type I secretion membrane fusion protein
MKEAANPLMRLVQSGKALEQPIVGGPIDSPLSTQSKRQMRAPVVIGLGIIAIFFLGFGIWAATAPISGAVMASGVIKVEANKKTLKSRDGGVIREINVAEGDKVSAGQVLIKFDDTNYKAQVEIFQNQYNTLLMQSARLQAEVIGSDLVIPPELVARRDDQGVMSAINVETTVYNARKSAYEGQLSILRQRISQLNSVKSGLDIQVNAIGEQLGYMREELRGYRVVLEQGYASKAIVNRLQRQLSEVQGRQGELLAEISRNRQQVGEAQLQAANLQQQRASESAGARTEAETKLIDLEARLKAVSEALALTEIKSPVEGYVFGLSQFTIGGVAAPGEPLMDIVPSNAPLIIAAQIRPNDIDQVSVGLKTQVTLQAYSTSKVPHLDAEVMSVAPDATVDKNGNAFYVAMVRILPSELKKLAGVGQLVPGMQATLMIKTGSRTFLSYLFQPIRENVERSLREE